MPRNSSRRSHSRSRSRTRSRTRTRSRSRSRDRRDRGGRDSYRDRGGYDDRDRRGRGGGGDRDRRTDEDFCRVHVADLSQSVSKSELEKAFGRYGEITDTWMAKNPPCFAFIVFKNREDADESIREMNGRQLGGSRIRVTLALPRSKGRNKRFDPNMRCYQCGERGHFSRDCNGERSSGGRRRYSRSGSRGRRDRDRSRSRSYTRSRTGSRTPRREYKNGNTNGEAAVRE